MCTIYNTHIHIHTMIAPHHSETEKNSVNSKSTEYNGCINMVDKEYKNIIWTLLGGGKWRVKITRLYDSSFKMQSFTRIQN